VNSFCRPENKLEKERGGKPCIQYPDDGYSVNVAVPTSYAPLFVLMHIHQVPGSQNGSKGRRFRAPIITFSINISVIFTHPLIFCWFLKFCFLSLQDGFSCTFDHVFDENTTQTELFDTAAKPIIEEAKIASEIF